MYSENTPDFFGGYWHDEDFGMGRYSTHDDKPGKKIWIWGLSQQGMIWDKLLTDTDGQYVEVQSGRLFNQPAEAKALSRRLSTKVLSACHRYVDRILVPGD